MTRCIKRYFIKIQNLLICLIILASLMVILSNELLSSIIEINNCYPQNLCQGLRDSVHSIPSPRLIYIFHYEKVSEQIIGLMKFP